MHVENIPSVQKSRRAATKAAALPKNARALFHSSNELLSFVVGHLPHSCLTKLLANLEKRRKHILSAKKRKWKKFQQFAPLGGSMQPQHSVGGSTQKSWLTTSQARHQPRLAETNEAHCGTNTRVQATVPEPIRGERKMSIPQSGRAASLLNPLAKVYEPVSAPSLSLTSVKVGAVAVENVPAAVHLRSPRQRHVDQPSSSSPSSVAVTAKMLDDGHLPAGPASTAPTSSPPSSSSLSPIVDDHTVASEVIVGSSAALSTVSPSLSSVKVHAAAAPSGDRHHRAVPVSTHPVSSPSSSSLSSVVDDTPIAAEIDAAALSPSSPSPSSVKVEAASAKNGGRHHQAESASTHSTLSLPLYSSSLSSVVDDTTSADVALSSAAVSPSSPSPSSVKVDAVAFEGGHVQLALLAASAPSLSQSSSTVVDPFTRSKSCVVATASGSGNAGLP
jgi:hypothetical protein